MRLPKIVNFTHGQLVTLLIVVGYIVLMLGNNLVALTDPDEVFYAQTAVEMVQHKSWLTPYLFDQPQFEKPIVCYWLMTLVTKIFGPSPFIGRFWPACFGIIGLSVTYAIAWLLFQNKRTAFLSGFVLGTSFFYIALSRAILTDMVFSVIMAISIGSFYYAFVDEKHKQRGIILFFVFSGIAVLTKGLLGFFCPMAAVGIFLISQRNFRFFNCRATLWGLGLFVLIVMPWHILMFHRYGDEFVHEYFYNVHVRRLFEAEHPRSNTWYFYPLTMLGGTFPWVFFLLPALWELVRQVFQRQMIRKEILFLISWCLGVLIFVQPAQSKLASYIAPVFPALAVFIAYFISEKFDRPFVQQRSIRLGGYLLSGCLLVAGVAAVVAGHRYVDFLGGMSLVYLVVVLWAGCAMLLFRYLRRNDLPRMIAAIVLIPLTFIGMLFLARPVVEPWVSCRDISQILQRLDNSSTVVLASKFYVRGVRYHTQRAVAVININGKGFFSPHPIPFLDTDEKVLAFLASQPKTFCIVRINDLIELERIAAKGGYHVTRWVDKGGRYLVSLEKEASGAKRGIPPVRLSG